ncbi:MAG: hypothetical protein WB870_12995 [Gallionellaceae bacterium]
MTNIEAANIAATILESMRRNPAQFNFNVNVSPVGAMGIGGSGGPGIVGIARGGGVGFSATAVSPSPAEIKFTQGQADAAINQQWAQIERTLEQLITELRRSTLTQEKADGFLASLKKTWLPNVVVATLIEIVKAFLGVGG